MKAVGSRIWSVIRAVGHGIWRFSSLIHNFDDVRETYPVDRNDADGQQLAASNMAANIIGSNGTAAM